MVSRVDDVVGRAIRWLAAIWATGLCATLSAGDITIGNRTLRVADGFEVELVTTPELVERPIAVARDERGRLYVTDSGGMTENAAAQLEKKPHRIRRLEDTDGDGHYDASTLFADRMMFPEGCLWYDGSLYVAAPPEIWKLTDDNDDGVADRREIWFDGKTLTGCGNDLHGPYLGPDGRFYWCKGAFAEQRHRLADGSELVTNASHIFRAKPDGSEMESVLTGGMDNPVNVAFLENGERFLSCTFFQHPEAGRRDGLIHAIYGGVYGKEHDCILAHPRTGSVMPVLNHQGAAAPCGLIAGSRSLFGGGYDQHLFACYFNLHKVVMHRLIPDGPTYTTEDFDLLSCDHPDFHPTDVFEDADGSLLIVDTGGWYKVCCPTSQLAKPDVLGAIYRVRRTDVTAPDDPLGLKVDWTSAGLAELISLLDDPRLFVWRRAQAELRKKGKNDCVQYLERVLNMTRDAELKVRIIWTLAGMNWPVSGAEVSGELKTWGTIEQLMLNSNDTVRRAAIHWGGLSGKVERSSLVKVLQRYSGHASQRAAAEALGRIGDATKVPALFDAIEKLASSEPDSSGAPAKPAARISEHALIYAVMQINDPKAARLGLASDSPRVLRAALVALDQMQASDLSADDVIPRMSHPDAAIRATCSWIVAQHPDWGEALSQHFAARVARLDALSDDEQQQDRALLTSLAEAPEIQSLVTRWMTGASDANTRTFALQVLTTVQLSNVPESWLNALAERLSDAGIAPTDLQLTVQAAQRLPQPKDGHAALRAALRNVAARADADSELRLAALDAAGAGAEITDDTFTLLTRFLATEGALNQRSMAANAIASAALTASHARATLIASLSTVGAMELPKLLPAFEREPSETQGQQLLTALRQATGLRGVRADQVGALLAKYPPAVQDEGRDVLKLLNASIEEQTAMLEKLLAELPDGDIVRGHEVFMSRKAACNTCHKLGYGGGTLGPDLTNLGRVRNRRDIVEALVFPSSSMVRGYEPVIAELDDGRVVGGIITSESAVSVTISTDAQKSTVIDRSSIAELVPSSVSPMPNGLVTLLSQQELADLVTFLITER